MNVKLSRLSQMLIWRGAVLIALGIGAVIWPSQILVVAMIFVSIISTLLGLYELSIAAAIRRLSRRWWLVLADGLASVGFGGLTAGIPGISIRMWLSITAGWLLLCAGIAWSIVVLVKPVALRRALVTWAIIDAALALLTIVSPEISILDLLFAGAGYAAIFGLWQLSVGIWLTQHLRLSDSGFARTASRLTIQPRS